MKYNLYSTRVCSGFSLKNFSLSSSLPNFCHSLQAFDYKLLLHIWDCGGFKFEFFCVLCFFLALFLRFRCCVAKISAQATFHGCTVTRSQFSTVFLYFILHFRIITVKVCHAHYVFDNLFEKKGRISSRW